MAKKNEQTAVVEDTTKANLPATAGDDFYQDAGAGAENVTSRDVMVPWYKILQALSPECNKRGNEHVEGAEPGEFMDSATQEVYSGTDGILVVPVYFMVRYTKWEPDRGALVEDYGGDSTAYAAAAPIPKSSKRKASDGNEITETPTWYVLHVTEDGVAKRAVLSFSSSQVKKSRRWMSNCLSIQLDKPGGGKFVAPLFYSSWRLTTVPEDNESGNWMGFSIKMEKPIMQLEGGADIRDMARAFHASIKKGEIKLSPESSTDGEDNAGEGDTTGGKKTPPPF